MLQKVTNFLKSKVFLANLAVVIVFGAAAVTLPVLFNNPRSNGLDEDDIPEQSLKGRELVATVHTSPTHMTYWVLSIEANGTELVSYKDIYEHLTESDITLLETPENFNGFLITHEGIMLLPPKDTDIEHLTGVCRAKITYSGLSCEISNILILL